MNQPLLKLNGRIWIETPEGKLLGHGRVELLERIHTSGSIRQAALQMKMSYKQAWDLVNDMNDHFSSPVVVSHRGGKGGGKAVVTEYGLKVVARFHQLQDKLTEFLLLNSQEIDL
ncbi:MAG: molybdate transport system regulatory protein [Mucilaginibacter sp.]|nr:molybdate transport system regulatory protein [Mucilaginibacter sp.]